MTLFAHHSQDYTSTMIVTSPLKRAAQLVLYSNYMTQKKILVTIVYVRHMFYVPIFLSMPHG